MTTDELRAKFEVLPCPFCGGIPVDHLKIPGRCIECQGCGASGPELPLGGDARDMERLWNHRTHASRDAEVEALREASTNSKINTHKFLYSKGLGNRSLRVCDCFDSTSIECLGLSSDIEFLEKLLSLAKKYEE